MSIKNYIILQKLGQGSFGLVEKVLHVDENRQYALKTVKYDELKEKNKRNAMNEINLLSDLQHPNIIRHKESFFDNGERNLYTVMELAPNGDLAARIKYKRENNLEFEESQIWAIGRDIINGITALHERNIIHRDIKPANILFGHQDVAKLGDMNVSVRMTDSFVNTQTGTPYYASPQIWNHEPYSFDCDIWSFGCVIYQMCTLNKPFQGRNLDRLFRKVMIMKYSPISYKYSYNMVNVIERCLTSRDKRATVHELKRIFDFSLTPTHKLENIKSCVNFTAYKKTGSQRVLNPEDKGEFFNEETTQNSLNLDRFLKGEQRPTSPPLYGNIRSSNSIREYLSPYKEHVFIPKSPPKPSRALKKPSIIDQIERAQKLLQQKYLSLDFYCF